MHVVTTRRNYKGRVYATHLLRRSFREDGKVKNETLGNLSHLPESLIEVIRRSLQGEVFAPVHTIELTALSELDLNDGALARGEGSALTFGCNWYLNENVRLMGDYSRGRAQDSAGRPDREVDFFGAFKSAFDARAGLYAFHARTKAPSKSMVQALC